MRGFLLFLSFLPVRPIRKCAKSVRMARIAGIPPSPPYQVRGRLLPFPAGRGNFLASARVIQRSPRGEGMILLPKCILWLPRPGIQSLWPHEDFAEPGDEATGKRTAYALAECALIMEMRSDRRMRPMPSFPTVCTSSSLPRKRESNSYSPRVLRPGPERGEKPPRYRCGIGILGWRECQESRASNAVIPAQAGIHLRAQRRSRFRAGGQAPALRI